MDIKNNVVILNLNRARRADFGEEVYEIHLYSIMAKELGFKYKQLIDQSVDSRSARKLA